MPPADPQRSEPQHADPQRPDEDPQLYARSFADVYDDWYGDLDDPTSIVKAFAKRLPAGATILELGSGTGRLSAPLAQAGFSVIALDASLSMLRQDQASANRVAADMQALPLPDASVAGVLIAYNTFFNLADRDAQQRCLDEVARLLTSDGVLAMDLFVAPVDHVGEFGMTIRDHPTRDGARLAIVTGPDTTDPTIIVGSHIELAAATTCRPWRLCYRSTVDLDEVGRAVGLQIIERCDDWADTPYGVDSLRHVSWYRRAR